jgi:fructose-bisphosphate aldolase class I
MVGRDVASSCAGGVNPPTDIATVQAFIDQIDLLLVMMVQSYGVFTPFSFPRSRDIVLAAKKRQMNTQGLTDTARKLVADDKGLLAMDESNSTCNKRFAKVGIPQTVEARRAYRELILTTPGLGESISGVILYDETIRQQKKDGTPFLKVLGEAGIIPGIKVDTGAKDLAAHPGEKITEGLDGLRIRLQEYFQMGARFAKWRAVISIGEGIPSRSCIEANAQALARYAALCQEAGLVPIVEPEVLMDGEHTLERCRKVTEEVLRNVFIQLNCQRVLLEGMILKPNMVLPGLNCPVQESADEVADITLHSLLLAVPAAVPGLLSCRAVNPVNWLRPV